MLPVLIRQRNISLVELGDQAVVTATGLAKGLAYTRENAVDRLFNRNKTDFKDFGLYDFVRENQSDSPCSMPKTCDTALVRMHTSGRANGGLQKVRVFTKRGALKVCMKSNRLRAITVQGILIDLYEKVEAGQLVAAARFERLIGKLTVQVSDMKREIARLERQSSVGVNLPGDAAPTIPTEHKQLRSYVFHNALRFVEVRTFAINLYRLGNTQAFILDSIQEKWSSDPERSRLSYSALNRFFIAARKGRLKDFGIDLRNHTLSS